MAEDKKKFYFKLKRFYFIHKLNFLNFESLVYSQTLGVRRKEVCENAEILGVSNKQSEAKIPRFSEFRTHSQKRKCRDSRSFEYTVRSENADILGVSKTQ